MSINVKKAGAARSETAVYKQIEASLRRQVEEGLWPAGTMLPSRRDLAKRYGVSPLTVERAVTGLISAGLLRADDRRGTFVLSAPERGGEGGRESSRETATIGIVGSLYLFDQSHLELNNFWVRQLIGSLEHAFSQAGHTTRFFNRVRVQEPGHPVTALRDTIEEALADGVDALAVIAFGVPIPEVEEALSIVKNSAIPLVCVPSSALTHSTPHVFYDNYGAGYQAAQHLLRRGWSDLWVFAPQTADWAQERMAGVLAAAADAGLSASAVRIAPEIHAPWVQEVDPAEYGYGIAKTLLEGVPAPGGVIGLNDGAAFGFLRAAAERGWEAGRDFALLGFDDHPQSRTLHLTSLRPPLEEMGQEASRLLRQGLAGQVADPQICLRWHLIPRASTNAPSEERGEAG